mgnify:CR=1 FL=1
MTADEALQASAAGTAENPKIQDALTGIKPDRAFFFGGVIDERRNSGIITVPYQSPKGS